MRFGAELNKMVQMWKDRKFTGKVVITFDVRDGGIGRIVPFETAKVPPGSSVLITCNGSYVLKESDIVG